MKIAIASTGKSMTDKVSSVCGRAQNFLIFEDKELIEVLENPFKVGGGGAGVSVAQMLIEKKVNVVVCGKFGPNVIAWLEKENVKHVEINDKTIEQALAEVLNHA